MLKATWEAEDQIRTSYPSFNEDKVVFEGSSNDTMIEEALGDPRGKEQVGPSRDKLNRPERNKKGPKWLEGFVKQ